jgi:hypothetical protein
MTLYAILVNENLISLRNNQKSSEKLAEDRTNFFLVKNDYRSKKNSYNVMDVGNNEKA